MLDVGSGSGYTCAVFHYLVSDEGAEKKGKVVGIDHIPQLVEWSEGNLRRDGLGGALDGEEIVMVAGDGRQGGCQCLFTKLGTDVGDGRISARWCVGYWRWTRLGLTDSI